MLLQILIFPILLLAQLLQPSSVAQSVSTPAQMKGRLLGKVLDLNGDPIAFARIHLSNHAISIELSADKYGAYETELPAGIYKVSSSVQGFALFRRASFSIQPATTNVLNLVLTLGGNIEEVLLPQLSREEQEFVVRYGLKQEQNGIIEYKPTEFDSRVMVSYDVWALYAEQVWIDKNTATVEAEGKVIIEDGKKRRRAKYAKLEVNGRNVELTTSRRKPR